MVIKQQTVRIVQHKLHKAQLAVGTQQSTVKNYISNMRLWAKAWRLQTADWRLPTLIQIVYLTPVSSSETFQSRVANAWSNSFAASFVSTG